MALGTVELVVGRVGVREMKRFLWEEEQSV